MPSDAELEKELNWTFDNQRGEARATAAAALAILRAVKSFDKSSRWLGYAMAGMTFVLVVLTSLLVWLTVRLLP